MPSTYTTNLGIEKIATGEQSGTWGTTTNTNFDLIDTAVNGIVSITLASAGTSGSPNDLPITDGTASNGRNKFIEFVDGGDLGATAYVQLTPNDAEKIVHIRNSLSGSRSIIVFQGTYNASNDFEIPNGADVTLKFDGAGTGATVTDVNVDLTVTGVTATSTASFSGATIDDLGTVTTADINGGTIDGTVIGGSSAAAGTFTTFTSTGIDDNATSTAITIDSSQDVTFTSDAKFPDNGKAIFGAGSDLEIYHDGSHSRIDEQGTGVLFLQTNGTNIQLNKGTSENMLVANVDGSVDLYYDNSKKLATTSTGIDVTGTVDVSGVAQIGGSTDLLYLSGKTGTHAYVSLGASSTAQDFFIGADTAIPLIFRTSATERMRIDSSGRVGIGCTPEDWDPAFDVLRIGKTASLFSYDTAGDGMWLGSNAFYDDTLNNYKYISTDPASLYAQLNGTHTWSYAASGTADTQVTFSEAMRIDSSGNVGIGTTSPDEPLVVDGGVKIRGTNKLSFTNTSDQTYITAASSNVLAFGTDSTERMRIDSSGNVGIGTTAPSRLLHLKAADSCLLQLQVGNTTGNCQLLFGDSSSTTVGKILYNHTGNSMSFETNGSERMRIDSSGNVGIGVTPLGSSSGAFTQLQIGGGSGQSTLFGQNNDHAIGMVSGAYYDASNNLKYSATSLRGLSRLYLYDGTLQFANAPSGTGGATATLTERMRINSTGSLILTGGGGTVTDTHGTASRTNLQLDGSSETIITFSQSGTTRGYLNATSNNFDLVAGTGSKLRLLSNGSASTAVTLDTSGNLLVGKTTTALTTAGVALLPNGELYVTRDGGPTTYFNRETSDGDIVVLRKDNTTVGSIASVGGTGLRINSQGATGYLQNGGSDKYTWSDSAFAPANDNLRDLGSASYRFDDVYATNGTIQTSDANEKQDIEALSEAETRVAVAAKALLRKFRWKSAVEEKGDDARIHFGIIAQDLQAAFEAEGLDAGDYAMFIHSTWTDEETGEERSRMGVRYSELLAFIIAAI